MGKTVTTYLIDGDPKGTQYSFISNKICLIQETPTPEAQQRCASTSHNEECRFLSAPIGHFPQNFLLFHPHSSTLIPFDPFSSTLIHTDPH